MNYSKTLAFILFIVGMALVLLGYFGLEKLPEIQREKIAKRLPFVEGAESTEKWRNSKDKGYLKIYLFNITNLNEYLSEKDKLIKVNEVGPIVYSYTPNITILNWTNNESEIKFAKARIYHFVPEMSKVDLETPINSVNIIAASIVDGLNNYNFIKRLVADPIVNTNFRKFNTTLFHNKTIDEILFKGYDISVLPQVKPEAASKYPDNLYGLMHGKNFSHDGVWTVNTGKYDISKLGEVEKWEEISLNNCWLNDQNLTCGNVIGTDGTRFHPGLNPKKDQKLNLYSSSLFRPLSMIYKRDYIFKGIKVSRYELEETNFVLSLEHNKCYCPDKEKTINGEPLCKFNGLLDISRCRGAPIIISAPHFLYGSPELLDHIKGLQPDLTKHESFIDVDPVTGISLKARKRLQINVYVRKHKYGHKDSDTVVPVMWIEEGQDITDEKAVLYYQAIYSLMDKANYFLIGCIILGTILIFSALVLTSIGIIRSNEKFVVKDKKKSDINHNLKYHKASTMPLDEKVKMTTTEK